MNYPMPGHMLLLAIGRSSADTYIRNNGWMLQPKFDGTRGRLFSDGKKKVTMISRSDLPLPVPDPVREAALRLRRSFVVDGELMKIENSYVAFDVLQVGSDWSMWGEAAEYRAGVVRRMFDGSGGIIPIVSAGTSAEKSNLFDACFNNGMEGVTFKRKLAAYAEGRDGRALKLKFVFTLSVISAGQHKDRSSVEMRLFDGRELGSVKIPNGPLPPVGTVIEVRALYASDGKGLLVQPVFLGVRDDVSPRQCTATQLQIKGEKRNGTVLMR